MGTMELTTLAECVLTVSAGKWYVEQPSASGVYVRGEMRGVCDSCWDDNGDEAHRTNQPLAVFS